MEAKSQTKHAFTLIELLIVVAIIAILAAIAVPNFLEAQLRAKVGRVKSDLRTVSMGMESYALDNNGKYPILNGYAGTSYSANLDRGGIFLAWGMTTPVAYVTTTRFPDPFVKAPMINPFGEITTNPAPGAVVDSFTYHYVNVPLCRQEYANLMPYKDGRPPYFILSYGPDYVRGPHPDDVVGASYGHTAAVSEQSYLADYATAKPSFSNPNLRFETTQYDPTNGTISKGDIIRHP